MSVVTDVRLASCETCATGPVLERTLSLTTLHGDPRLVRILVRFDAGANTMQLSTCVCPLCSGCVREPVDAEDLDEEPEIFEDLSPDEDHQLDPPTPQVSIEKKWTSRAPLLSMRGARLWRRGGGTSCQRRESSTPRRASRTGKNSMYAHARMRTHMHARARTRARTRARMSSCIRPQVGQGAPTTEDQG